jgi:hypothetical protein
MMPRPRSTSHFHGTEVTPAETREDDLPGDRRAVEVQAGVPASQERPHGLAELATRPEPDAERIGWRVRRQAGLARREAFWQRHEAVVARGVGAFCATFLALGGVAIPRRSLRRCRPLGCARRWLVRRGRRGRALGKEAVHGCPGIGGHGRDGGQVDRVGSGRPVRAPGPASPAGASSSAALRAAAPRAGRPPQSRCSAASREARPRPPFAALGAVGLPPTARPPPPRHPGWCQ